MMQHPLGDSTAVILHAVPRPRRRSRLHALPPAARPVSPANAHLTADPLAALGGLYTASFGFVLHALVNGSACCVPLVPERAPDLVALERAVRLIESEGGFAAGVQPVACPVLHDLAGARPSLRVGSELSVRVRCRVSRARLVASALERAVVIPPDAERAVDRAVAALACGDRDAAIASAHNAMVVHGIGAVALALGNAPGRVSRGVERYAARLGRCAPLCSWRVRGALIEGELELPLELSVLRRSSVRAPTGNDRPPAGRDQEPGGDVALLAACVGMAASLTALEDAVRTRASERRPPAPPPRRRRSTPARARGPRESSPREAAARVARRS